MIDSGVRWCQRQAGILPVGKRGSAVGKQAELVQSRCRINNRSANKVRQLSDYDVSAA